MYNIAQSNLFVKLFYGSKYGYFEHKVQCVEKHRKCFERYLRSATARAQQSASRRICVYLEKYFLCFPAYACTSGRVFLEHSTYKNILKISWKVITSINNMSSAKPTVLNALAIFGFIGERFIASMIKNRIRPPSSAGNGKRLMTARLMEMKAVNDSK